MRLAYKGFEKTGRQVADVIDAPSLAEATDRLRHRELFVTEIAPIEESVEVRATPVRRPRGGTRRLKNLVAFTRQLYVLIRAGTPLTEGLRALERQARDVSWRQVISHIRSQLERGVSLSKAMESQPECFDVVYRNMVAAGEVSGKLSTVLDRLAQLTRKRLRVRRTILGAMIYPCLLVTVSVGVFAVLLVMVVPRFAELFDTLDVPLPPTTAALVSLSEFLRSYWWAVAGVLAAAVTATVSFLKSPTGRRLRNTVVLRLPYIGRLVRSFTTAQIARLLGVLLDSHLPILEALELTRRTVRNVHYVKLLGQAEQAVTRGEAISSAFQNSDLISPSVYEATRSGEQSGQVSPLLLDLAEFLDEENEIALKGLISILEPTILILMGLMVGFVALSIFTPLFDATSLAGGGAR